MQSKRHRAVELVRQCRDHVVFLQHFNRTEEERQLLGMAQHVGTKQHWANSEEAHQNGGDRQQYQRHGDHPR